MWKIWTYETYIFFFLWKFAYSDPSLCCKLYAASTHTVQTNQGEAQVQYCGELKCLISVCVCHVSLIDLRWIYDETQEGLQGLSEACSRWATDWAEHRVAPYSSCQNTAAIRWCSFNACQNWVALMHYMSAASLQEAVKILDGYGGNIT